MNAAIIAAALQGRHMPRLKAGDPSNFGRAWDPISAASAAGIKIEIISGVTIASAALASLCEALTQRGLTELVVLATATWRPGGALSASL